MKLAAVYHKLLVMSTQCCKKIIYNKQIKQLWCFICVLYKYNLAIIMFVQPQIRTVLATEKYRMNQKEETAYGSSRFKEIVFICRVACILSLQDCQQISESKKK